MTRVRKKWRPSMALVVAGVCLALVSIPLAAMVTAQLTSSQFIRETEQSLVKQGAVYAEIYRARFAAIEGPEIGHTPDEKLLKFWNATWHPLSPKIDMRTQVILPPLPDGAPVDTRRDPRHDAILPDLERLAGAAGKTTLAGVIFLDHDGVGVGEEGLRDLSHAPEVQSALHGDVGVVLRARDDDYERHALNSISRDTGFRVFVAYPVIVKERVVGAVLLSRTPINLQKFLFRERDALLVMAAFTVLGALVIGVLLFRLMSKPVRELRKEARAIANGEKVALDPLRHYGMCELADLGDSMLSMAATLDQRSREIATYTDHVTHELKSPVTSITGAVELLQSAELSAENRAKLLDNIEGESRRMNTLLMRLREMSQLKQEAQKEGGDLALMLPDIDGLSIEIVQPSDPQVPLSNEHGAIILLHMANNARAHGARNFRVQAQNGVLHIMDDGEGVPENDIEKLADPFFTTRRTQGGTGMGLAIVSALLEIYEARLRVKPNKNGARFEIEFL